MKRLILSFCLMICSAALLLAGCSGKEETPVSQTPTLPTEPVSVPTEPAAVPTEPAAVPTEPAAPPTREEPAPTDPAAPPASTGEAIAELARSLVGTPFQMGATGPDAFDNSGFVYYCYRQNGVALPRRTSETVNFGAEIGWEDLQPGDVVLFSNDVGGPATFEGIYIGGAQFVSCNNPDTPTKVSNMAANYWKDRFIGGRRAE